MKLIGEKKTSFLPNKCQMREIQVFTTFISGRQHLLPHGSRQEIDDAVDLVYKTLWKDGGCIAQCEFGPGANPDNVYRVFERWGQIGKKAAGPQIR